MAQEEKDGVANQGFEASTNDLAGEKPAEPGPTIVGDGDNDSDNGDENKERGNWSGKLDFLLSCLGYAVGLGNVWRFPYLCYKNGGAAFFIPYVIMLFMVGMPIFFLELALGQFSSSGPLTCFKLAPLFTGVGYGMVIVSGLVAIYYNMIIGWSLYYLFASFTSVLPWDHCDPAWASEYCFDFLPNVFNCTTDFGLDAYDNGTCYNGTTRIGIWNESLAKNNSIKRTTASEEYLNTVVLGLNDSPGIHDLGPIRWQLAMCLLLAWIIVFFCLIKGIKSSGKVVYFTALFPYAVLVILLIRGVLLEGHLKGITFYILDPDISRLKDVEVWKDAAVQIFFSLSACWGGLITLASYNKFHNNCLRDAIIVSLGNCLTSFFAGFVIFSYIGFLAGKLNVSVDEVARSGPGLAFVVYPEAVALMPVAPLWAILFFFMLLTLGLDSQFTLLETVVTAVLDTWPKIRRWKPIVVGGVCVIGYFLGLTMCTNGGMYMLNLLDNYAGGWSVLLIGVLELVAVNYVYGVRRFMQDIGVMLGTRFPCAWPWWAINWCIFSPGLILFVLLFSWVKASRLTLGDDYLYPDFAMALAYCTSLVIIIPIVLLPIIFLVFKFKGSMSERLRQLVRPTVDWGPALVQHRQLISYVPGFVVDPSDGQASNGNAYPMTKKRLNEDNGIDGHYSPANQF
ncbi:sodium- and chloride-dependent glycine transporter 1 [Lingula anatina]|uniref:Transporter n=1 Tax=Lingula anatina TaxID=7574 RepID=A0A1S3J3K9_LINAN|nr:sodium- and chloride-dependent glycine transporter 1 [Lingula anatina]|eukprot:XP_013404985.1 sodium- and chloride-dependent glycine transporter 1 [Lingula anatina]